LPANPRDSEDLATATANQPAHRTCRWAGLLLLTVAHLCNRNPTFRRDGQSQADVIKLTIPLATNRMHVQKIKFGKFQVLGGGGSRIGTAPPGQTVVLFPFASC
jgi:hypothetical protein